jgi:hypothetical protein
LTAHDCYVREHEVVNLFAFGHLVPLFIREQLQLTQIGIEYPVRQAQIKVAWKPCPRKDLVIWQEAHSTAWNGGKPLAVIEWKHISKLTKRVQAVRREHKSDIDWLMKNRDAMGVGFAIMVERSASTVKLTCVKVGQDGAADWLVLPGAKAVSASS